MKHKTGDLRVKAKWIVNKDGTEDKKQYLQKHYNCWFGLCQGWETIDEETIPKWAWIEDATTGYTEWISKFTQYGKFGRDGNIIPKETVNA